MMKVIAFDIGGVVLAEDNAELDERVGKIFSIDAATFRDLRRKYYAAAETGALSAEENVATFAEEAGVAYSDELKEAWLAAKRATVQLDHEVVAIIQSLRENYKVVSFTNVIKLHNLIREELDVYSHFDENILSSIEGIFKPNEEFYHLLFSRLGVKPEEILLVDDAVENIATAKELGMPGILFTDAAQLHAALMEQGIKL